jgi:phosphohistidine phosphatase
MTERTLLVLRHSKSAYPEGAADWERPLSARGRRDAATAGNWLRDQGLTPDLVVCSTAERTRETWDLVSDQLGWAGDEPGMVRYDSRLYEATPGDLLTVVRETPDEVTILALVGHNPGSAELVLALAGRRELSFPTSALAVIGLGGWAGAGPGSGTLQTLWTPKGGSVVPAG